MDKLFPYQGWDKVREETLARQLKLGVVPTGTKLAPKPEAIKDWDNLTPDEQKLYARQMEVFAGFGEYADTEIGRLIDAIKGTGELDNTVVFYVPDILKLTTSSAARRRTRTMLRGGRSQEIRPLKVPMLEQMKARASPRITKCRSRSLAKSLR